MLLQLFGGLFVVNKVCWFIDSLFQKEITWKMLKNTILTDSDYIKNIQVDEIAAKAYFAINNDDKLRQGWLHYFVVPLSRHTDFETKLKEIYGGDLDGINIAYNIYKPMFAQIYDILFVLALIYAAYNIISSISNIRVEIDDTLMNSTMNMGTNLFPVNESSDITFDDVIGMSETKKDLEQYVSMLQNNDMYVNHGCKPPKGLIFAGPPGTGKTLMAKAMASEAGVPILTACGSDFVEIYVGTGAKRVRNLFAKARQNAPCVIFIDEIDAVGKSRDSRAATNTEMASTVNALLVEMDGFTENDQILVIAATNLKQTLDNALTRSGRFDRTIVFDRPNKAERLEMFNLYLKDKTQSTDFKDKYDEYTSKLSELTAGLTGADISNIANQAMITHIKDHIDNVTGLTFNDIENAIEDVCIGMTKKERTMTDDEKKRTAYHEAGHALVHYVLRHSKPPVKISIIPRGQDILGYTQPEPDDRKVTTREELYAEICGLLGGRIAEEIIFDSIATGAYDDIKKVTKIANSMIRTFGMDDEIGEIQIDDDSSDEYKRLSDVKANHIVKVMRNKTKAILEEYVDELKLLAEHLLEHEVMTKYDIDELLDNSNAPKDGKDVALAE